MNTQRQKLELRWVGKEERPRIEPRVLLPIPELSFSLSINPNEPNLLIEGDNLLALKALLPQFASKIQCIYIDPPYNTGSIFQDYDDSLEHSIWLGFMQARLELLKQLLSPSGVFFVSIDDNELGYLMVLMDEVFGRKNNCGLFVWEKKKKPSFLNSNMGNVTEYILAYAKDRVQSPPFVGGVTTEGKKYPLNNAGNGVKILTFPPKSVHFKCKDQVFKKQDMSEGNIKTELLDQLVVKDGFNQDAFRLQGEWRYSQTTLEALLAAGERIIISKAPFRPNHIKAGGDPKKLKNLLSVAHYGMATYEDATAEGEDLFGNDGAFDYPKPEKLLQTLIEAVTEEDDWVLDCFAGSGTTGAVASKLGRHWIMVESGKQCRTNIVPRMKKVIAGEDRGGVSASVGWSGGGAFKFFRLAPSLIKKDIWGNEVINPEYNPEMVAEAVCILEGFVYDPSQTEFWKQGNSTESDFIYVTTQTLSAEQLERISDEVGPKNTLLVCCGAFRVKDPERFANLTLKKIPKTILDKCEWDKDDYSLKIGPLPLAEEDAEEREDGEPAKSRKSRLAGANDQGSLFTDEQNYVGRGTGKTQKRKGR